MDPLRVQAERFLPSLGAAEALFQEVKIQVFLGRRCCRSTYPEKEDFCQNGQPHGQADCGTLRQDTVVRLVHTHAYLHTFCAGDLDAP